MILLWLLAALACAGAGGCPPSCACRDAEGERVYSCGGVEVRAMTDDFAKITCDSKNITDLCAQLTPLPLSEGGVLHSVQLISCPLPDTFECLLQSLGATAVRKVMVDAPRGGLTVRGVRGLEMTTLLMVTGAVDQTTIPYDVISALPSLADFRLRSSKLRLPTFNQSQPFTPHPSLKFVELSADGIEELPRGAFMMLRDLPQLHLWGNRLKTVRNDSFMGLEKLENLDLSRNPLEYLPMGVFSHTPRLTSLTLVADSLEELQAGVLDGLEMLEKITIKFNTVPLTLHPLSLSSLPSLTTLTIDRCILSPLPSNLLRGDTKLQQLIISDAGVELIPVGFFEGLISLEVLNLKENKIKVLEKDIFRPLKGLKKLELDGNLIEVLPSHLLAGLSSLTWFSANRNRIHTVSDNALRGAVTLTSLSLANNMIELVEQNNSDVFYSEPPNSPFSSLLSLHSLILQNNRLARIPDDWRLVLTHLRMLDLRNNLYTELTKADVQFLADNITVDLRNNKITTIELVDAPPWWPETQETNTNSIILLDDNPFKCDCQLYSFIRRLKGSKPLAAEPKLKIKNAKCHSPSKLKGYLVTNLSPNQLTCELREEDCPKNCACELRPSNQALELDCNEGNNELPIPSEFGLNTMHLKLHKTPDFNKIPDYVDNLNISGAGLTEIKELPDTVKVLDLSNNLLTKPPEFISRNISVYLEGNNFICDCSHYEDVVLLQRNMDKIVDFKNVMCDKEFVWKVNAARLCDVKKAGLLGGILAALGVIIALAAALAYKYSLEIRVFLYSKGLCLKLLQKDDLDENMVYDAFVSFSQKDAKFVAEQLVPKLEGEHNLRLCVHYRDWLVGDMIPAQIARSVEQSKRTIIVLSKNFLESSWALLEFRAAHLRAEKDRKGRVLVVVLELPSQDDMDSELKAYLTTNTYLKWGDPWFWEKLLYALPHKKSSFIDKLHIGGLQTRLNADGKIVNDAVKVEPLPKY